MMTHLKRFSGIPMSKTMREICKEEDYTFLEKVRESREEGSEQAKQEEDKWRRSHEERIRRKLERKQTEDEWKRKVEEIQKQRDEQWRGHIAELAAGKQEVLRGRAHRLQDFRNFQRKILEEEMGLGQGSGC